jgi:hypothetical protein
VKQPDHKVEQILWTFKNGLLKIFANNKKYVLSCLLFWIFVIAHKIVSYFGFLFYFFFISKHWSLLFFFTFAFHFHIQMLFLEWTMKCFVCLMVFFYILKYFWCMVRSSVSDFVFTRSSCILYNREEVEFYNISFIPCVFTLLLKSRKFFKISSELLPL